MTLHVERDDLAKRRRVDPQKVHVVNRGEVTRILEKIERDGVGSLSPDERVFLVTFVPRNEQPPA